MVPIRLLIVDDSAVVRRLLGEALVQRPEIVVVGTASTGALALAKIPQLNPDVITLDVEMPGMNGIETLVEIRKRYPRLPVIMFSTLTERGAGTTLEALSLGASDYVTKPSNSESLSGAMETVRRELTAKIISLAGPRTASPAPALRTAPRNRFRPARVDVVAIGTSTGGPNALAEVIPLLPGNLPVPVVVVQHMPPLFTRLLAERLNSRSRLTVVEGAAGQIMEPGHVYIAPGDFHMMAIRQADAMVLGLNRSAPENSCRPAVDVLFRSVAETYGSNVLAVVMTGMGSDGARGAQSIREAGGEVLVQDEASSVIWGMPGAVVRAGAADKVLPLSEISGEIVQRVLTGRASLPLMSAISTA